MVKGHTFELQGTCAKRVGFVIDADGLVRSIRFTGGCPGGLSAMSKLLDGKPVEEVIKMLDGIMCGNKGTSCADQLALALQEINSK